MHVIRVRNVNQALPAGLNYLHEVGIPEPSRAGEVIVAPGPVTTVYERPNERVLFSAERDANPFFHFFESLWMLGGRNDLDYLEAYLPRFKDYSDDGLTLYGAYGHRLRKNFGYDQFQAVVGRLKANRLDRRTYMAIWAGADLLRPANAKDIPCNTGLFVRVSLGKSNERNRLDMMTVSRSHDIIWGAYGANAVHFSYIQEYLAGRLDLEVGTLTQVSWNYHAYKNVYEKTAVGALTPGGGGAAVDLYAANQVQPYPMIKSQEEWDIDLGAFFNDPRYGQFSNPFFAEVAKPLHWAHIAYRRHAYQQAREILDHCKATDWQCAAIAWVERRRLAWASRVKSERRPTGMEHPFGYDPEEDDVHG